MRRAILIIKPLFWTATGITAAVVNMQDPEYILNVLIFACGMNTGFDMIEAIREY